jgi:hypothetical protein
MSTTIYYTLSHPEYGKVTATRDPDGTGWLCARDFVTAYTETVLKGSGINLGPTSEEQAASIFKDVPSRYKAVKRFQTSEGFCELLGIKAEGIEYFFENLQTDVPNLTLVK